MSSPDYFAGWKRYFANTTSKADRGAARIAAHDKVVHQYEHVWRDVTWRGGTSGVSGSTLRMLRTIPCPSKPWRHPDASQGSSSSPSSSDGESASDPEQLPLFTATPSTAASEVTTPFPNPSPPTLYVCDLASAPPVLLASRVSYHVIWICIRVQLCSAPLAIRWVFPVVLSGATPTRLHTKGFFTWCLQAPPLAHQHRSVLPYALACAYTVHVWSCPPAGVVVAEFSSAPPPTNCCLSRFGRSTVVVA
jgi:hypothetical protein